MATWLRLVDIGLSASLGARIAYRALIVARKGKTIPDLIIFRVSQFSASAPVDCHPSVKKGFKY